MAKVGDMVEAVWKSDETNHRVYYLGRGVYVGSELNNKAVSKIGKKLFTDKIEDNKIVLDSGEVVWGSECFWSIEEVMQRMFASYRKSNFEFIKVTAAEMRAGIQEAENGQDDSDKATESG